MTNEELLQKYRLLKLVSEPGERSYHALDADGHIVMVHYLPGNSPETQRLLALLDALGPVDKTRIVERVEVDGAPVLVTQFIQGFKTLAAWLQSRTQRPRAATPPTPSHSPGAMTQMFGPPSGDKVSPAPEPTPAPAADLPRRAAASNERGPGETTAMFGPSGAGSSSAPPAPAPSPPPPPEPPRKAASSERAPGEFTGLFGAASPGSPPPGSPPPEPTVPPVEATAPPPGDKPSVRWREPAPDAERSDRPVVRWKKDSPLDEPPAQRAAPPPPPGRSPKAAGEFTRLFGPSGLGPADSAAPPAGPPSPAAPDPWADSSPPSAPRSPGEFTRMFQPEKRPGGPPPIPSQQGPRDYLQALNAPAAPTTPPASLVPPAPQPSGPGPAKPPGEFTRLMSGIPATPAGAPPGGAPRANPPAYVPGGPSDFTRIVSASAAPRAASPSAEPAAEEEPPKRRSPRLVLLLIALGVVGVLAVAVVLYFVLKNP